MARHRIRYTQAAIDDLDAIFDYIAIEDQNAALKMLAKFERSIERLAEHPNIGMAVHSGASGRISAEYRYVTALPYLIFYQIKDDQVCIGRILHSRQDWLHLLFRTANSE